VHDRVGEAGVRDQRLLSGLGLEVAPVGHALGPDHRQRDVLAHARRALRTEQVAGRAVWKKSSTATLEGRRVGDVDHHVGAFEHAVESLAGQGVHARVGDAGTASCPCSPSLEPMRPVPPMTTIFIGAFLSFGGSR
jgi:hypothetical protein